MNERKKANNRQTELQFRLMYLFQHHTVFLCSKKLEHKYMFQVQMVVVLSLSIFQCFMCYFNRT